MTAIRSGRGRTAALVLSSALAGALLASVAWLGLARRGDGGAGAGADLRPVGAARVAVATVPGAPKVGENLLRVRVADAAGRPLRGARVDALVFMPQMGAMPYMESRPVLREVRPGVHEGRFNLVMGGSWDVRLAVTPPGGSAARAALRLTVETTGLTWVSEEAAARRAQTPPRGRGQRRRLSPRAAARRSASPPTRCACATSTSSAARGPRGLRRDAALRGVAQVLGLGARARASTSPAAGARGEVLFTVYSPELYAAQQEYLEALAVRGAGGLGARAAPPSWRTRRASGCCCGTSRAAEIDATRAHAAAPRETLPVRAPVGGRGHREDGRAGAARYPPGQTLYRIAPMDPVWVAGERVPVRNCRWCASGDPVRRDAAGRGRARRARARRLRLARRCASDTRTGGCASRWPTRRRASSPACSWTSSCACRSGGASRCRCRRCSTRGERRVVFVDHGDGRLAPRDVTPGHAGRRLLRGAWAGSRPATAS